ncbi:MAG TPA: YdeI/OmpD-associated family protein [Terriglobales bacterium]|nr:YdeI/OmpD-associated family protein [Terriglobales bacterium]
MEIGETLYVSSRKQWRKWLEKNHAKVSSIWLVYCNQASGKPTISYEDSMEEALCFGWIDGIIKKIDTDSYTRRFTPRKPGSGWSEINVERYERARKAGLLTEAGIKAFGEDSSRKVFVSLRKGRVPPPELAREFEKHPKAKAFYEQLAPSNQAHFVNRIENAKRQETRAKWVKEAVRYLLAGKKSWYVE